MPHVKTRVSGKLHEAFQSWLNQFSAFNLPDDLDAVIEVGSQERTGRWLISKLWHCTDIMPSSYCRQLLLPDGSSYAKGVRYLKQWVEG